MRAWQQSHTELGSSCAHSRAPLSLRTRPCCLATNASATVAASYPSFMTVQLLFFQFTTIIHRPQLVARFPIAVRPLPSDPRAILSCIHCSTSSHSRFRPGGACVGISPDQATRLLDGECLPLHGSSLTQHIHPPPAVQSVDLVRRVQRDANRACSTRREPFLQLATGEGTAAAAAAGGSAAAADPAAVVAEADAGGGGGGGGSGALAPLAVSPAETLHLQMTPAVRVFAVWLAHTPIPISSQPSSLPVQWLACA